MKRFALSLFLILIASPFLTAQGTTNSAIWRDFTAWKEPQNADRIPGWSLNLLVRFRDVSGTAREELLAKTLSELKDIVSDANVVPPTRYNAILTAGQLVSQEGVAGVRLPEAYPAALTTLVDLYQEAETPHYLQYGALLGIVRHTVCGIAPSERDKVIDLLLKTITTERGVGDVALSPNAVAPMEPAVWDDWFRQTALEGISALKTTGTENKIVSTLLSVINGKSLKLEFLCRPQEAFTRDEREQTRRAIELASKAAKTLGDLDYKSRTDVDADKITDTFLALVKAVCEVAYKMAADSSIPMEQIIIDVKIGLQSVGWGIRSGFLTAKQADHSLYASLKDDDPATKRLNMLMAEILELSAFLDEGDKANKPVAVLGEEANGAKKAFKFDLPALREALAKSSQALATMQRDNP